MKPLAIICAADDGEVLVEFNRGDQPADTAPLVLTKADALLLIRQLAEALEVMP